MLNRSRNTALALPALSALLVMAAACAPAPEKVATTVEDGISNKPNVTVAQVAKGQSQRRLAMPVAASAEESAQLSAQSPAVQKFLAGEGKGWSVVFDRRSGAPMYFEGPGIPWTPGRGNALAATAVYGNSFATLGAAQPKAVSARLQSMASGLLARHQGLVGAAVLGAGLTLDSRWSGAQDDTGELLLATFRHALGGTEVSDARLTYVVNNGNLVQIHAEKLVDAPAHTASLSSDQAWELLRKGARVLQTPKMMTSELKVVPLLPASGESSGVYTGAIGAGYETHLAYLFRFQLPGDTKTYAAWVDASSGETLDLWDDNRYASHIEGSIYPRTNTQAEVIVPFQYSAVTAGSAQRSDLGGNFTSASSASSALAGGFFNINDTCGAPAGTATSGNVTFTSSPASDCSFSSSGHSTRAARNAFYHLNIVRQVSSKWLGSGNNSTATSWFATDVGANVNLSQTCNAFWDGSTVNFFQSDSTCSNTGEIADVMQHEFGHGLDHNTKSGTTGDTAKGEAMADTVALLLSRDNCVGPGFFKSTGHGETTACPTAVRDFKYSVTKANIATKCQKSSGCAGALGYECHCESHLLSGATWDLSQAYVQRYGTEEGWHQFERVYLRAIPMMTAYLPNTAGNAYSAFLAADDDNGNTTDGTPNSDLINAAFNAHGLANTAQPASNVVACPSRPAAVTLTATAGAGKVDLSWTAVSGATGYTVLRRLVGHAPTMLPVGGSTAAAYSDTQVFGGVPYEYSVYGTAGACTSPLSTPQAATPTGGTPPPPPSNDFSVAVSPASVTVAAGASGAATLTTPITSGSAQSVALSVSGLPAGVTGSFSPATVTAGGTSTLTITAASSAAAASATATITGTAASGSHSATLGVTVTVTAPPANDFTLAVSPASLTLAAGATGTASVATTIKSGSAQSLALSVSGLPAGVTAAFSPATVTAGGTSTLTITAASSAAAASASATITGTSTSGSHTATLALTIISTTPPPPAGALTNGDFENALTGWTIANKVSLSTDVHGGKNAAQVGLATPFNGHSTLTQAFVVPATGVSTLSFFWKGFNPGADTTKYSQQIAELRDSAGKTLVSFFNTLSNDSGYKQVSQDISAYNGQTVTLYFESHDDGYSADPTWMLVDDVTLVNAQPDTQAPVASFSAPSGSAALSGTVTVTASATDNVGVTKVELFADGVSIGSASASSASASWNTTTVADGAHSLLVKASDAAGNVGTATLAVTVKNATTPPPTGLVNGDFENKLTGWLTGGTQAPVASSVVKHGGSYSGRMGWMSGTTVPASDSALGQNVAIPASATSAVLTFYVYRYSEDVSPVYDWQTAAIRKTDGTTLKVIFDDLYNDQVWVKYTVDLTSYKGTTVQLFWNAHNDGDSYRTTLWVDDVALTIN